MSSRVAIINVTPDLLRAALKLPENAIIVDAAMRDDEYGTIMLKVQSDDLPEVTEGESIPHLRPSITRAIHECGHETSTWEWYECSSGPHRS